MSRVVSNEDNFLRVTYQKENGIFWLIDFNWKIFDIRCVCVCVCCGMWPHTVSGWFLNNDGVASKSLGLTKRLKQTRKYEKSRNSNLSSSRDVYSIYTACFFQKWLKEGSCKSLGGCNGVSLKLWSDKATTSTFRGDGSLRGNETRDQRNEGK